MASKQDLIDDLLGAHPELSKARAKSFVNDLLATLTAALRREGTIRIAEIGTFRVVDRAARTGRNPRTGAPVAIPAARVVRFRASAALRTRVNTPLKAAKRAKP